MVFQNRVSMHFDKWAKHAIRFPGLACKPVIHYDFEGNILLSKGLNCRRDAFKNFYPHFSYFCSSLLNFVTNQTTYVQTTFQPLP
jgi:hypothetical protein